jgi:hypothetical protein
MKKRTLESMARLIALYNPPTRGLLVVFVGSGTLVSDSLKRVHFRRLDMHKTQGIEHLSETGMSKRKIPKTLGINRKSVDLHLAESPSKGASTDQSPTG